MHNGLRSSPEIQRGARRAFGLGIEDEGLERMGETLGISADFWIQPDWRYLRSEKMLGRGATSSAVAAQQSYVAVNNPLGSGILAIFDRVRGDVSHAIGVINSSAAIITGGAVLGPGFSRDTRWSPYPGLIQASGQLNILTGAAAAPGVTQIWTSSAGEVDDWSGAGPIVIHPGYAFVIHATAVNTALTAWMLWRERRAFPGELP